MSDTKGDIIINGVSIAELKKTKAAIQKDASAFIANGIAEATALIKQIVGASESGEEVNVAELEAAAEKAVEILDSVKLVSGVSDVTFYLPFYEEWGYANERPYTSQLEEAADVLDLPLWGDGRGAVADLYGTLEDMEYDSRNWHSSRC